MGPKSDIRLPEPTFRALVDALRDEAEEEVKALWGDAEGEEAFRIPDLYLVDPDFSYDVWRVMKAFDFRLLPYGGGILDQPDWLMHDLLQIQSAYNKIFRWVMARRKMMDSIRRRLN